MSTKTDKHDNSVAIEGVTRCPCGVKYWESDKCVDCGAAPDLQVAEDREETEPCQKGTSGCCVDHGATQGETDCETW